jgi:hypothetical protein
MAESKPSIVWNGWRTLGPTHPVTQISRNHDERPTWQVKWWWLIVALFFRPNAFAVLRLMSNSNLSDCWIGKSAGLRL